MNIFHVFFVCQSKQKETNWMSTIKKKKRQGFFVCKNGGEWNYNKYQRMKCPSVDFKRFQEVAPSPEKLDQNKI